MTISEIKEKEVWEKFLSECEEKTFLQSWNWGEFQKMMGSASGGKIWRFGVYDNNRELFSVALIVKMIAKRGTFLLVPHGPAFAPAFANATAGEKATAGKPVKSEIVTPKVGILKILLEKLKEIGREEKVDFIRISPIWPASAEASAGKEKNEENNKIFKDLGFKPAPIHMHPEASWKLDIRPSEEELLMNMRKTTRYLIRQAQKDNDIEVFQSKDINDIKVFYKIHLQVVRTQKFIPFSLEYLKNEFSVFNKDNQIVIFFGKYKNEIIAASYVLFWSGIGFYHHAALLPKFHKIPVSYLLQWEAIKEAKKRNCVLYDFWGYVDPKTQAKHPWSGPTLFKMGFGGRPFEYVKTQDFPLSRKYWLTYIFEKLRKTKRGF